MIHHFTTDEKEDETELHRLIRAHTLEPPDTENDKEFTIEETKNALASMNKKASGEDGRTGEEYKSAIDIFPQILNCNLQLLPAKWSSPEMEGTANSHSETGRRKQQLRFQIPPNKSSQYRRKSTGAFN